MGCWYRWTLVRVAISRPFVSLSLFFGGGGVKKVSYFPCFGIKQASFKVICMLNGVHIWVFFNTESFNARATHFKVKHMHYENIPEKTINTFVPFFQLASVYLFLGYVSIYVRLLRNISLATTQRETEN